MREKESESETDGQFHDNNYNSLRKGGKTFFQPQTAQDMGDTVKSSLPICAGCGKKIRDPTILHVSPNMDWHATCLRCAECNCSLEQSSSCYLRNGRTYCKADYCRFFGMKCAQCGRVLRSSDMVFRAGTLVYHQQCFRCLSCEHQFVPGDAFILQSEGPYCQSARPSFEAMQEEESLQSEKVNHYLSDHAKNAPLKCHVKKQFPEKLSRIRTVLTEQQLQALQACYAVNPRPDAILKERLVGITGLGSRVIRVWFQNKRCKDKKKSLTAKSDHHQDEKVSLQGLVGTRMVARSPQPQGGGFLCTPIQVQSCEVQLQQKSESTPLKEVKEPTLQQLLCFCDGTSFTYSYCTDVLSATFKLHSAAVSSPEDKQ